MPTTVSPEEPTTAPTMEPGFNPVDLSDNTKVTLNKTSYTYNDKAKKPGVTVTADIKTLTKNTDYIVSYKNNIKVGTASVVITGTGDYTGSMTLTFKILPKGISTLGKSKVQRIYRDLEKTDQFHDRLPDSIFYKIWKLPQAQ